MADRVQPIGEVQQQLVVAVTNAYVRRAAGLIGCHLAAVAVSFDLTGRAAGMYRVRGEQRLIRYNPYLFAKYFEDNLAATVPHEVAHYVTDMLYGLHNIRPHGSQWRAWMAAFAADAARTCNYDLSGVPRRRHQRYAYRCHCSLHQLTSRRHNKVLRGKARYICRSCGGELEPTSAGVRSTGRSSFLR